MLYVHKEIKTHVINEIGIVIMVRVFCVADNPAAHVSSMRVYHLEVQLTATRNPINEVGVKLLLHRLGVSYHGFLLFGYNIVSNYRMYWE